MNHFALIDWVIFVIYVLVIVGVGLWVSRTKKGEEKTASDYFLAGRSLTWWAIGASLIAANISAEHFIAMSGSGYAIGLAVACYEWIAAAVLLVVAKYFLPVFLRTGIYTMPQFLNKRYDRRVSTSLSVFWLLMYVFVNLTSVSYLGALALEKILGVPLMYGIVGLSLFAAIYSLYGGLKAVAWTDVIQVVFLVGGGLITTVLALDAVSGGAGAFAGLKEIIYQAPERFTMIIEKGVHSIPDGTDGAMKDAFLDLPGVAVILGSMWLTNTCFWGFNQYIIQRGLAAKSVKEAQYGLTFAAFLKLLVPLLVVIPGIAAYVLQADISKSDEAYPWLLNNIVPPGITGLAFAALVAAVVSSLSSIINSTSTIFTMDIYKEYVRPDAGNKELVRVGRIVAFVALLIATLIAPKFASLDQVYPIIQEYTGFIYPGIFLIFFMGIFWRHATTKAALWTAIFTLPVAFAMKFLITDMPFIIRIGYVFIVLSILFVGLSLREKKHRVDAPELGDEAKKKDVRFGSVMIAISALVGIVAAFFLKRFSTFALDSVYVLVVGFILLGIVLITNAKRSDMDEKALIFDRKIFKTSVPFNLVAIGICGILAFLYFYFW
ncbi:sodium/solute symporter [Parabacteroides sp. PF5-6]|uniref:sodium:solute symporter family transporter n=1 Tax=Parabacteroides sp. PF5-6 TaxID=1742403 RepID=UPI0024067033|nr:sodium/solute symporter [Parabacteroides sp. PF5-6]MDF9828742.1 SSS family solute:Na+ symporter [Parabacteroides sp. PF5-6]